MATTKISKAESNSLYRTIKFIHDTFVEKGISYWITGGNLLGAVRHQGLIPWDDDGDICIMLKDVPKLASLIPYFKKHGYILEKVLEEGKDECLKSPNSCDWYIAQNKSDALGVDVFVMKMVGDKITYANPYWETAQTGGKKCYFLKRYVFPLIPVRYGNFYTYMPNNPVEHLNRCYGSTWNDKSRMLFNHRTGEWIESKPKKMLSEEYDHPKAPRDTCDSTPPPMPCPMRESPKKTSSKRKSPKKKSAKRKSPKKTSRKRRSSTKMTVAQKRERCRSRGLVYDPKTKRCRKSKIGRKSKRKSPSKRSRSSRKLSSKKK